MTLVGCPMPMLVDLNKYFIYTVMSTSQTLIPTMRSMCYTIKYIGTTKYLVYHTEKYESIG